MSASHSPSGSDPTAALDRARKRRDDAELALEAAQTALRKARDELVRAEAGVRDASRDRNRALAGLDPDPPPVRAAAAAEGAAP